MFGFKDLMSENCMENDEGSDYNDSPVSFKLLLACFAFYFYLEHHFPFRRPVHL